MGPCPLVKLRWGDPRNVLCRPPCWPSVLLDPAGLVSDDETAQTLKQRPEFVSFETLLLYDRGQGEVQAVDNVEQRTTAEGVCVTQCVRHYKHVFVYLY